MKISSRICAGTALGLLVGLPLATSSWAAGPIADPGPFEVAQDSGGMGGSGSADQRKKLIEELQNKHSEEKGRKESAKEPKERAPAQAGAAAEGGKSEGGEEGAPRREKHRAGSGEQAGQAPEAAPRMEGGPNEAGKARRERQERTRPANEAGQAGSEPAAGAPGAEPSGKPSREQRKRHGQEQNGGAAQENPAAPGNGTAAGAKPAPGQAEGTENREQRKRHGQEQNGGAAQENPAAPGNGTAAGAKPAHGQAEETQRRQPGQQTGGQPNNQPGQAEQAAPNRKGAAGQNNAEQQPAAGQKGQQPAGQPELPKSLQSGAPENGAGQAEEGRHRGERNRNREAGQNGEAGNGRAESGLPENATPFESRNGQAGEEGNAGRENNQRKGRRQQAEGQPETAGPPPRSDAAAQRDFGRVQVESVDAVEGRRIKGDRPPRHERPDDARVVKEIDGRTIFEINNQVVVQSTDRPRLTRGARDVYYEDLPDSRTRETIVRPDGSRIVTIRNQWGDVIRRSRFTPDNREIVMIYVDNRDLDEVRGWDDPGADLPPIRLDEPVDDYILDAREVQTPDRYYDFLVQPPVEPVRRIYSLGEVKRSARIRDIVPRIDLDTINFDFGSATISESEAQKLQNVADAIKKIIDRNPAETFLLEGHTDAVGSAQANLVLSDQRAEAVAAALTNYFDIPAENLTTQGYGEEFLKVNVQGPNRENRRVTIRRITPLVAPVASNE